MKVFVIQGHFFTQYMFSIHSPLTGFLKISYTGSLYKPQYKCNNKTKYSVQLPYFIIIWPVSTKNVHQLFSDN